MRRGVHVSQVSLRDLLWVLAALLVVMWVLGFSLHFTLGGFIHVLLALAIIAVLIRVITGRRLN